MIMFIPTAWYRAAPFLLNLHFRSFCITEIPFLVSLRCFFIVGICILYPYNLFLLVQLFFDVLALLVLSLSIFHSLEGWIFSRC